MFGEVPHIGTSPNFEGKCFKSFLTNLKRKLLVKWLYRRWNRSFHISVNFTRSNIFHQAPLQGSNLILYSFQRWVNWNWRNVSQELRFHYRKSTISWVLFPTPYSDENKICNESGWIVQENISILPVRWNNWTRFSIWKKKFMPGQFISVVPTPAITTRVHRSRAWSLSNHFPKNLNVMNFVIKYSEFKYKLEILLLFD